MLYEGFSLNGGGNFQRFLEYFQLNDSVHTSKMIVDTISYPLSLNVDSSLKNHIACVMLSVVGLAVRVYVIVLN